MAGFWPGCWPGAGQSRAACMFPWLGAEAGETFGGKGELRVQL